MTKEPLRSAAHPVSLCYGHAKPHGGLTCRHWSCQIQVTRSPWKGDTNLGKKQNYKRLSGQRKEYSWSWSTKQTKWSWFKILACSQPLSYSDPGVSVPCWATSFGKQLAACSWNRSARARRYLNRRITQNEETCAEQCGKWWKMFTNAGWKSDTNQPLVTADCFSLVTSKLSWVVRALRVWIHATVNVYPCHLGFWFPVSFSYLQDLRFSHFGAISVPETAQRSCGPAHPATVGIGAIETKKWSHALTKYYYLNWNWN